VYGVQVSSQVSLPYLSEVERGRKEASSEILASLCRVLDVTERELLARVASGLFHAPSVIKADMLQPLRASIYAFKTDFVVASWIARLKPNALDAARAELAKAGFANATIRNYDDSPRDTQALTQPIDIVMDVEPRNDQTMAFPGRGRCCFAIARSSSVVQSGYER